MEKSENVKKGLEEVVRTIKDRLHLGKAGFIQKEEILDVLKKIGSNNPFAALVEFTMSFDPKEVHHVIAKLEELISAITHSMADDTEKQKQTNENAKKLIAEIHRVHHWLKINIHRLHGEISDLKAKIAELKK